MNIKDGIFISLLELFHGIVVRRDKTLAVSTMTSGRRCAGCFFPFVESFDEFLHSDTWLKGLNLPVRVRQEEIYHRIGMDRWITVESVGVGRSCG